MFFLSPWLIVDVFFYQIIIKLDLLADAPLFMLLIGYFFGQYLCCILIQDYFALTKQELSY